MSMELFDYIVFGLMGFTGLFLVMSAGCLAVELLRDKMPDWMTDDYGEGAERK